jgi:protein MpaA
MVSRFAPIALALSVAVPAARAAVSESASSLWKWQVIRELATPEFAAAELCRDIDAHFAAIGWRPSGCADVPFSVYGWSVENRPLIQFEFGNKESKKLTLLQCAVHGDERPAVPMCLNVIRDHLDAKRTLSPELTVVVQPLANPDGFFRSPPTRPNANGIDVNRNFPTPEWEAEALDAWKKRDKEDPRKFPGKQAGSEPETQAIIKFVSERRPQKIIQIHTPLGFLELDTKGDPDKKRRAQFLAINMLKNAKNLDYKAFGVWPGSMGNWAGRHLGTPVYTLELPTGESARQNDRNWDSYGISLWRAFKFDLETGTFYED